MTATATLPKQQDMRPMMEERAKLLATQRASLADVLASASAELSELTGKWGDKLKEAAAAVDESERTLVGYVEMAPFLFVRPQSIEVDGVRFGLRKGKGRLEYADEKKLIDRIERQLTKGQRGPLLKITKKVLKGPLARLSADVLKRLGVNVKAAGTEAFVGYPKSDLEKRIEWWLKPHTDSGETDDE